MNKYEVILIGAFCLFVLGLIMFNIFKKGKYMPPVFLITDTIYERMYSKYRLFIDEDFKDRIVCWTNRVSIIFMAIGTILLIVELVKKFIARRKRS